MTYSIDPTVGANDPNALVADYEDWLHARANALTGPGQHDDLVQEGRLAVWQAAQSFEPGRGQLPHWVTFKAENRMKDVVTRNTWTGRPLRSDGVRSSVTLKGLADRERISSFVRSCKEREGIPPTQARIARELGMSVGSVNRYLKTLTATTVAQASSTSLEELLDSADGTSLLLSTADLTDSISLAYHRGEITRALDSLTLAQKKYVVLRFWCGYQSTDLTQVFGYDPKGLWDNKSSGARVKLREALAHLA